MRLCLVHGLQIDAAARGAMDLRVTSATTCLRSDAARSSSLWHGLCAGWVPFVALTADDARGLGPDGAMLPVPDAFDQREMARSC